MVHLKMKKIETSANSVKTKKKEAIKQKKKPLISMIHVYKKYKIGRRVEVNALNDFNLNVYEGEFVVILGPSGSGKTTLVNLIGCLDKPTDGDVLLLGKNIKQMSESNLAQMRGRVMGFVFQQFNLLNTFTALENVALPLIFHNSSRASRTKIARELLTKLGLGNRLNHKPNQLSGGQQQRVAIARALSVNPKIIIADEPTGNLDSQSGNEVIAYLKQLHKEEGKTVILVTHDVRYLDVGTRTVKIFDGHVVEDKPNIPKDVSS